MTTAYIVATAEEALLMKRHNFANEDDYRKQKVILFFGVHQILAGHRFDLVILTRSAQLYMLEKMSLAQREGYIDHLTCRVLPEGRIIKELG